MSSLSTFPRPLPISALQLQQGYYNSNLDIKQPSSSAGKLEMSVLISTAGLWQQLVQRDPQFPTSSPSLPDLQLQLLFLVQTKPKGIPSPLGSAHPTSLAGTAKPSRTLACPGHRNGTGAPGSYCQVQLPAGACSSAWLKGLQIPVLLPAEPSRGAEPCLGTGSSSGLRGSSGCWALPFVLSR